ncbi:sulfotransferase family 2 domain-containing protein [Oscillatoria sp. FACHB-1406]|uniref:sulfotransferase family 2 domain-containing protein n=1 Tax=Oscillatoria sp. FACHB-1406 TaxID=2692846 RepID=UPI0016852C17|nr:sulfotransferase family 2 domain-containing protein [Oscillatoria sp. FACHB-1406]MBD2579671.1 sulfotransferase family 2 domain-containing protein [Oscillatoria sp. FACHB-1406]
MIDRTRKLIFIHISRTGGTSIETALAGKDWWLIDAPTKHITAAQARQLYGEKIWNSYTKFSVVRNPWDRIVSMWACKWWHQAANLNEDCSFETFIKKLRPHSNETYKTLFYNDILNEELDFTLRFETLQQDFSAMLNKIGASDILLPHIEKREHKHYTAMYNLKERKLVANLFKKDIYRFGYKFPEYIESSLTECKKTETKPIEWITNSAKILKAKLLTSS